MKTIAYRIKQHMTPIAGEGSTVQPPSYMATSAGEKFAVSTHADGTQSVILSSTPAEAHAISEAIRDVFGEAAPGIFVKVRPEDEEMVKEKAAEAAKGLAIPEEEFVQAVWDEIRSYDISTWSASHRHADAVIRHSLDPELGKQVWDSASEIGRLIRYASNGEDLAKNFPNSAILGYWLSSRSPRPTRVARSVTSTITGYDASPVRTGTTKGSLLGAIPTDVKVSLEDGNLVVNKGKEKPSNLGFGAIPTEPHVTGYRCGKILREATVNVRGIEHYLDVSAEMSQALTALAVIGAIKGGQHGLYRSGTSLVITKTVIEAIGDDGSITAVDEDELVEKMMKEFENSKHLFAAPITAHLSEAIVSLVAARMKNDVMTD